MEKLEKEKKKVGICTRNTSFVYTKNTNGITLVALVITIIVLLILAGIINI